MVPRFAKTPHYVLKDGSHPTRPIVLRSNGEAEATVIFGFSDKPQYDAFQVASSDALTPYPLVKGYLQNQIASDDDSLKLVVLDGIAPHQQSHHAATFQHVLDSLQSDWESVPVSHLLVRDVALQGYRIETVPSASHEESIL